MKNQEGIDLESELFSTDLNQLVLSSIEEEKLEKEELVKVFNLLILILAPSFLLLKE